MKPRDLGEGKPPRYACCDHCGCFYGLGDHVVPCGRQGCGGSVPTTTEPAGDAETAVSTPRTVPADVLAAAHRLRRDAMGLPAPSGEVVSQTADYGLVAAFVLHLADVDENSSLCSVVECAIDGPHDPAVAHGWNTKAEVTGYLS